MRTPRASIVMVAWGKRPVTEATLESLDAALGARLGTEFELVLVDNASPDDTLDLFARWEARAVVVRLPENRNFSGGCNAGAAVARGDVLLFLNNDMEFVPGVLETLVDQALEPGVGIVGTRLLFPDGTIQHGGVIWRRFAGIGPTPVHLFHFEAGDLPHAQAIYDLDAVTGACMTMRREVFEDIGGFDMEFVNGLEDIDLCVRVRLRDLRIVYRGDLFLVHLESATRGRNLHVARANLLRFHKKWDALFDDDAETVARLFDGELRSEDDVAYHGDFAEGTGVSVDGHLSALGSGAAEARALLAALERAGLQPAARDRLPTWVAARATADERELLERAGGRIRSHCAVNVHVPEGRWAPLPGGGSTLLRLAAPPRRREPLLAGAVWAATPWLAAQLVEEGMPADRVAVVPPVIADVPAGPGGDGILVLIDAQDLPHAARIVPALAALRDVPIRFLPNVAVPRFGALVAEHVPGAEVLPPLAPEADVAVLAGRHDLVVGAEPSDLFDRRPLVAAAAGTPVVMTRPGPCSAVLGADHALDEDLTGDDLATALAQRLDARTDRATVAAVVRQHCSPASLAERVPVLLEPLRRELRAEDLADLGQELALAQAVAAR
jgi:GT2 family glycosyltransferase